jgi:2',3'-cyclic-nucleotide 2'-phosphodiesterase (5'-nucleotidase family)
VIPAATFAAKPPPPPSVTIQVLNVSDWHGQIPPLSVTGLGNVGGSAALAAYWAAHRASNPNSLTLTAGDDFGATPPISAFFDDEPAVIAQRMMGIQVGTFGNHNFDAGIAHLQSQVNLAGAATDGDHPGSPYSYVAANLRNLDAELTGVDKIKYFTVAGVKIAIIGIVNEEAPTLVFPGNFGSIQITASVAAANKYAAIARKAGANAVFVITHKGLRGFDGSNQPFGELIDFANGVNNDLIDVIFGDHTDIQFSGTVNGIHVLENRSKGLTYAKTDVTVQPGMGGRVTGASTAFVTPLVANVTPDATINTYIATLQTELNPILGTIVGESSVPVLRSDACGQSAGRTCESRVGDVTTDAMRLKYGTDFAITNSGGLRAALTCPAAGTAGFCPSGGTNPPYPITLGSVFGVLPFGNTSATLTVNGAELKSFLENGVSAMPGVDGRFPQVSGLCFTYDIQAAPGSRVTSAVRQAGDGTCTGPAVDLTSASTYGLAINDFMASGGDGYPNVFSRVTTRDVLYLDVADYVTANTPISPSIQGRIVCTTSGATACPVITAP